MSVMDMEDVTYAKMLVITKYGNELLNETDNQIISWQNGARKIQIY